MSGPQTAKSRRPNWVLVRRTTAAQVVVERSRRWVPTGLNSMRSDRYIGHRWLRTWCISDAILNVMRYLTGSQCKSCRAAVVCDRRSRPSTSRSARAEIAPVWRGKADKNGVAVVQAGEDEWRRQLFQDFSANVVMNVAQSSYVVKTCAGNLVDVVVHWQLAV